MGLVCFTLGTVVSQLQLCFFPAARASMGMRNKSRRMRPRPLRPSACGCGQRKYRTVDTAGSPTRNASLTCRARRFTLSPRLACGAPSVAGSAGQSRARTIPSPCRLLPLQFRVSLALEVTVTGTVSGNGRACPRQSATRVMSNNFDTTTQPPLQNHTRG